MIWIQFTNRTYTATKHLKHSPVMKNSVYSVIIQKISRINKCHTNIYPVFFSEFLSSMFIIKMFISNHLFYLFWILGGKDVCMKTRNRLIDNKQEIIQVVCVVWLSLFLCLLSPPSFSWISFISVNNYNKKVTTNLILIAVSVLSISMYFWKIILSLCLNYINTYSDQITFFIEVKKKWNKPC